MLKLFDPPKAKKKPGDPDDGLDAEDRELLELAGDIDEEERITQQENDTDDDAILDDDDDEGWVDEVEELSEAERAALKESIRPVRLVLVKVSAC